MHLPAKICKDHKSCFLDMQSGENVITCYAVRAPTHLQNRYRPIAAIAAGSNTVRERTSSGDWGR